jgi:cell pole-organizing protein PopZ
MEEILSSIRRIIADEEAEGGRSDEDEVDQLEAATDDELDDAGLVEPEDDAEEDVLELTKVVRESGEVVDLRTGDDDLAVGQDDEGIGDPIAEDEDAERAADDDVAEFAIDADDHEEAAVAAAASVHEEGHDETSIAPATAYAASVVEEDASQEDHTTVPKAVRDELLSDAAASAATGAFAKLSHAFQRTPVEESIADGDGRSIEQFVEDIIRPMLRDWLDEKLPPIVERLVEKEIHKIARRAELM